VNLIDCGGSRRRAGSIGSRSDLGLTDDVSRRAACRRVWARRPGLSSCHTRSARWKDVRCWLDSRLRRRQAPVLRLRRWCSNGVRPASSAWRRRSGRRALTGRRRVHAGLSRRGPARSRCRAAMRLLLGDRRQRRALAPGNVPAPQRPGCVSSGEGGTLKECLGEMVSTWSQRVHAAKARQPALDLHGRDKPSKDALIEHSSQLSITTGIPPPQTITGSRQPKRIACCGCRSSATRGLSDAGGMMKGRYARPAAHRRTPEVMMRRLSPEGALPQASGRLSAGLDEIEPC
jgi:hypothetical protein